MIGLFGDARDRGEREFRCAEQHEPVTALEGGLLAYFQSGLAQRLARRGRRQILKAIRQRAGMRTAADAFAMGVEQNDLDASDAVVFQGLRNLQPQPLDQIAGGELSDVAARVGIAELQRQLARGLQIVAVMRAA